MALGRKSSHDAFTEFSNAHFMDLEDYFDDELLAEDLLGLNNFNKRKSHYNEDDAD